MSVHDRQRQSRVLKILIQKVMSSDADIVLNPLWLLTWFMITDVVVEENP